MRKLLLLVLLAVLPTAAQAQTLFTGTSFEEPAHYEGTYTDTLSSSTHHPLINNEGEPLVNYTSTGGELGFSSYYHNTRGGVGLTEGDYVGVTNTTFGFSYSDGTQGFQMSDTDGRMTLTLDEVDLSGATDPHVSLHYFVREASYETNDTLRITVVADGEVIELLDASGPELEELATGQFQFVQADLSGHNTATLKLSFDANADSERVIFDDIQFTEGPRTTVQFSAEADAVPEGDAGEDTYELSVSISNPSASESTTAEVVVTGGSATEDEDYRYETQTVTFPAGSAAPQTVEVTIIGDTEYELNETADFLLRNVSGGSGAAAGPPASFTLTIQGDDASTSPLVINEILADPPTDATCEDFELPDGCGDANNDGTRSTDDDEFIELLNTGASPVDVSGYTLSDDKEVRYTFPEGTVLAAGTAATIFGGGNPQNIPGFVDATSTLELNNTGDVVTLHDAAGVILATYSYGSEAGSGQSLARDPDGTGSFVHHGTIDRDGDGQEDGDLFSPGYENTGQAPLPVELISFEAVVDRGDVILRWATASETNNAGFEIQHKTDGAFQRIGFVEGHGTTSRAQSYLYRVEHLPPGSHVFRLRQVDFDGAFSYSSERGVVIDVGGRYALTPPHPNPFRATATFALSVEESQNVTIDVYNMLGQRVRQLFRGRLEARHERSFTIEARGLPSGLYFYRITGGTFSTTRPVLLAR